MQQEVKHEIIEAANLYIKEKGLTNADISKSSGINEGYLSHMLRGIFTVEVNGKDVEINDRWFKRLAATIGHEIAKVRIDAQPTIQFVEIITALENAKEKGICGMLIGETGCGKTYATDKFVKKNPAHTYRITVSSLYTLPDIMNALLAALGLNGQWRSKDKLELIGRSVRKWSEAGDNVIILIDEAENLSIGTIRMLKGLYDIVADYCSIVLIGTPELIKKLDRMKDKGLGGVPQFCRRFKAGTRYISPVNGDYSLFLDKYVKDKGLRSLLVELCDNYGELTDYLLPVMIEANNTGKPLTEELFRLYHNMPKF